MLREGVDGRLGTGSHRGEQQGGGVSPLDWLHRIGELLEPRGHLKIGRAGATPMGPYVAAWTTVDPWRHLVSAAATSHEAAAEGLLDELVEYLRASVRNLSNGTPEERQLAQAYALTLLEYDGIKAARAEQPGIGPDDVLDVMRSRGEL